MTSRFTQQDVVRAIRGARKAGMAVHGAEIDPRTGRIIVLFGEGPGAKVTPLDDWRARRAGRSAEGA